MHRSLALCAALLLTACSATPPVTTVEAAATATLASASPLALPADLGAPLFKANASWAYKITTPGKPDASVTWATTAVDGNTATVRISSLGVDAKVDRSAANPYGGLLGNWAFDFPAQQVIALAEPVTVPAGSYKTVHYTYKDVSLNSAELAVEVWVDPAVGMVKAQVTRHDNGPAQQPGPSTYELTAAK
jgi:hypothetical protein